MRPCRILPTQLIRKFASNGFRTYSLDMRRLTSYAAAARPRMNALRNTTIDGKMPMIRCSRTRQRGNRTGMGQPGQTAGDVSFPNGHRIPRFGSSLVWEIDYADVKSQFLQMTQVLTWQRGRSFWEGQVPISQITIRPLNLCAVARWRPKLLYVRQQGCSMARWPWAVTRPGLPGHPGRNLGP